MLNLYQIGHVSLHWHDKDIWQVYKTDSNVKPQQLAGSWKQVVSNGRFDFKPPTIKTAGVMLSSTNHKAHERMQRLRSLVGQPTTIIAYFINNEITTLRCACECTSECGCEIYWLQAMGTITGYEPKITDVREPPELTLEIDLHTFWQPLDTHSWHWGSGQRNVLHPRTLSKPYELVAAPTCQELFMDCDDCHNFVYQHWNSTSYIYDPEWWIERACVGCNCYPEPIAESGMWENFYTTHIIEPNEGIWGAPPVSIYALRGLPTTEKVKIVVVKAWGLTLKREESVLDLPALNTQMGALGYEGLRDTDIIYVGELSRYENGLIYQPSFVMRDGALLEGVRPIWTYPDKYPGLLGVGPSNVMIEGPAGGQAAYLHVFRRV